ncbi:sensor histidine kinase [Thalassomonas actiniarum]|uniref:Histidine kinase n=1 Tax=Thalassomonas actiniarum TaxID=485447 RepID=A0AAF0C464_9GAMM|nr:histidine kinase [Thalassomonas actiniarum]WDE00298.1 histidine kinase [Thalassomonas actiniarum]
MVVERKLKVLNSRNVDKIQAWIFLAVWPWLNIILISLVLQSQKLLTPEIFFQALIKMWGIFLVGYFLSNGIKVLLRKRYKKGLVLRDWLYTPIVIFLLFSGVAPIVDVSPEGSRINFKFLPYVIMLLESLIYMAVMYIFQQQEYYYRSQLQARQSELQMLKLQSNPHFLFNTLNLIATEITRDAVKAEELIYCLSDLLRDTVRLSKKQLNTVEEELQLVELYLLLQQRRFEDRLTFDIDCPVSLNHKLIPSLILLPVVENAIKYGIAPFARSGHVGVNVDMNDGYFELEIQDTGSPFDDSDIQANEGFRILIETLKLHFVFDYVAELRSSNEGASMKIRFPEVKLSEQAAIDYEL